MNYNYPHNLGLNRGPGVMLLERAEPCRWGGTASQGFGDLATTLSKETLGLL